MYNANDLDNLVTGAHVIVVCGTSSMPRLWLINRVIDMGGLASVTAYIW